MASNIAARHIRLHRKPYQSPPVSSTPHSSTLPSFLSFAVAAVDSVTALPIMVSPADMALLHLRLSGCRNGTGPAALCLRDKEGEHRKMHVCSLRLQLWSPRREMQPQRLSPAHVNNICKFVVPLPRPPLRARAPQSYLPRQIGLTLWCPIVVHDSPTWRASMHAAAL